MVELGVKIFLHPVAFFSSFWETLDLVVVAVSLGLDLAEGSLEEVLVALIVIRCWRLVRIIHGVHEVMDENAEGRLAALEAEAKELRERCRELEAKTGSS